MTSVDFSLDQVLAERYRLHGLLGRGGMSDVYRADDLLGGGQVALKIVRSDDPSFARRLVQEAGALERLEHPGLVRLLDAGTIGDRMYLAMELVEGPTLVEVLRDGPMTPTRAARLGRTVAGTLAYVHRAGVVHRDVKPGNVMLDADGTARLGDFGIALLSDTSTLTAEGTTLGTAAYMAPEQLEDHHVGPEADVWSLGIVLLECLTGRRVYEGSAAEVVARRLAGPVPLPSSLPTPWRLLLVGMLDHRPDQRLKDEEVEALLSGTAFDPPWMPDEEARTGATKPTEPLPADLTALDETKVAPAAMFPVPPDALGRRRRHRKRILVEMTAGVLALALVLTLLLVITGSRSPHATATSSSSHATAKKSGDRLDLDHHDVDHHDGTSPAGERGALHTRRRRTVRSLRRHHRPDHRFHGDRGSRPGGERCRCRPGPAGHHRPRPGWVRPRPGRRRRRGRTRCLLADHG